MANIDKTLAIKPVYTNAFKTKVYFQVITGAISKTQACRMYGVPEATLYGWIKKFKKYWHGKLAEKNMDQNQQPIELPLKTDEELREALLTAELKIAALESIIDAAEEEFSIEIRKKYGAQQ